MNAIAMHNNRINTERASPVGVKALGAPFRWRYGAIVVAWIAVLWSTTATPVLAQGGVSTLCRFTAGPRAGQVQDYAPMAPIPVGSPCQDGISSYGVVIARPNSYGNGAPGQAGSLPPGMTLTCRFTSGPRAGQVQDYSGVPGARPAPIGAPCTDGISSNGVAVAASNAGANPPEATGNTPPGYLNNGAGQQRPLSYGTCRNQCNSSRDQCISNCGSGPDHINNPNWLSCRHSCREEASSCRDQCTANGGTDDPNE